MNAPKKISILDLLKKCRKFAKEKNVHKGIARRAVLHACAVCLGAMSAHQQDLGYDRGPDAAQCA